MYVYLFFFYEHVENKLELELVSYVYGTRKLSKRNVPNTRSKSNCNVCPFNSQHDVNVIN